MNVGDTRSERGRGDLTKRGSFAESGDMFMVTSEFDPERD